MRWALEVAGVRPDAAICDVACGPGADTETLSQERPNARIDAVDLQSHFIAAVRARDLRNVTAHQCDMLELPGQYDFIWCAGAAYIPGVERALTSWAGALRPGGAIAFSEPCHPGETLSKVAREFWGASYTPASLAGIEKRIDDAGFRTLAQRWVIGAPWAAYYDPMQSRIDHLRQAADKGLTEILDAEQRDIDRWKQAPNEIAYSLHVVVPK